ncbi:addiction module antitoxin RelB [Thioploca ingrica]|uniref:Addiction module antitoxin RelB n=1 Tax=Thioploca ingrica TaxID=40754 RepID=A0A090AGV6_9GAMM|nr:addiction module antitoxin RelB [Thioploca ingrica]
MKYEIVSTNIFDKWFAELNDAVIKRKVLARIARVENGHFGDFKHIAVDLYELRFFFGSGLRIYYTIHSDQVVLLLVGGDKSSQSQDIKKAKQLLNELE